MRLPQFTKGSKREGFYQSKGGKDNSSSQVDNGREKDVILIVKVKQKITCGLERAQGMGEFVLYLLREQAQTSHQWIASLAIRVSDHMIQGP
ncbi:hypothetical protein Tco_0861873 [Tanacetum coccineum]